MSIPRNKNDEYKFRVRLIRDADKQETYGEPIEEFEKPITLWEGADTKEAWRQLDKAVKFSKMTGESERGEAIYLQQFDEQTGEYEVIDLRPEPSELEYDKPKYRAISTVHIYGNGDQKPTIAWEGDDLSQKPKHVECFISGDMEASIQIETYDPVCGEYY
jgi:hypothetical protein